MENLSGKTAFVTGVSSGIGSAIAQHFLEVGAQVYGTSRKRRETPEAVHHIAADLTNEEELRAIFDDLPALDILINNAGVAYSAKITDGDSSLWQEMWALNVHATALCCQLAIPKLSQHGTIVNVSSLSGHRVPPSGGFYAPTKFAVTALTSALRQELAAAESKIRVCQISPGFVETPLLDVYFAGKEQQLAETKKKINMLQPADVAHAVLQAVSTPPHVVLEDIKLRSVDQQG